MMKTRSARLFSQELSGERGEERSNALEEWEGPSAGWLLLEILRLANHLSNLQPSSVFLHCLGKFVRVYVCMTE